MRRFFSPLAWFYSVPAVAVPGIFVFGILVWGGFNWSLELTNTEAFCISCHDMRATVFPEYRKTRHYTNRIGVRASCPDCHVPRDWGHKVVRKVRATRELYHWLLGTIDTPEKFQAARPKLARSVWAQMKAADSRECRNCHDARFMVASEQTERAALMHTLAQGWGMSCIECHQGIAHALPADFDREAQMDRIHDRIENEEVDCTLCHPEIVRAKPGDGWD
ncbi:MAG: NapC/NirT family cytochrome c [Paracoccaceae bacterium]